MYRHPRTSEALDDDHPHADPGTAAADRRILARRELPVSRPDLPARQPAAAQAVDTGRRETDAARALGHDAGTEFHLRAPEPRHLQVRRGHDLRVAARARR